jgi:hypothetical protein
MFVVYYKECELWITKLIALQENVKGYPLRQSTPQVPLRPEQMVRFTETLPKLCKKCITSEFRSIPYSSCRTTQF